jgi:hypothetical protein
VRPIQEGGDYLDVFLTQTARYRDLIKHEAGDFLTKRWTRGPIEVLFIDIAKTQDLNSHIIREFFPHLIPGRSLVVHQDFYHCWHPYIHVTMEALSPYFEILDEHIEHATRLYLYAKPAPSGVIAAVADYAYTAEDRIALLDALSAKEIGRMRAMIEVVKLWQLAMDGNAAALLKQHASIIATYGQVRVKDLWWRQTHEVMADYEKYHQRVAGVSA